MSLSERRVVVTRAPEQAGRLTSLLEEAGARVLHVPTIEIAPPSSWAEVDDSIRTLAQGGFDWVAFTSTNGVERFFSRLGCMPGEVFKDAKVAAVGSATERTLSANGVAADLVPERYTAVDLANALGPGESRRILLPRAEEVPDDMVEALQGNGWDVQQVTAYRNVPARPQGPDARAVAAGNFDVVTLTSASTARGFGQAFPPASLGLRPADPPARLVACIGPVTARACEALGMRVDVVPEEHTAAALVAALVSAL